MAPIELQPGDRLHYNDGDELLTVKSKKETDTGYQVRVAFFDKASQQVQERDMLLNDVDPANAAQPMVYWAS